MKRHRMYCISSILAAALFLLAAPPSYAMTQPPPQEKISAEELLPWYKALCGETLREGLVTEAVVCNQEVVLGATGCRVDIILLKGLRIPAGAKLTVDNPNLVLMGNSPAITVEAGGVLHIRRWNVLTGIAMPLGGIVVKPGGTLVMENGVTLPKGVVLDLNQPPDTLLPPNTVQPEEPESPDSKPEEALSLSGEVMKVTAQGALSARLTLPGINPAHTQAITFERSGDALHWSAEYCFRWNEDGRDFRSSDHPRFGVLVSKTRSDGSKTDFQYLAALSGEPFYLRAVVTKADGSTDVSAAIRMTEPPVGQYPGSEDYEDSGGNRGGGGQGTAEREAQKQPEAPKANATIAAPQDNAQGAAQAASSQAATAEPPCASVPVPQETAVEKATATRVDVRHVIGTAQETVLPAQASPTAQGSEAAPRQKKQMGAVARNGMAATATLALCGGIWVVAGKRKKH